MTNPSDLPFYESDPTEKTFAQSLRESVWKHTATLPDWAPHFDNTYPSLLEDITVDIGIVGAGITGVTAAVLLQNAGYQVALLESRKLGFGVSGSNSGHLTTILLDMKYKNIIASFGEDATRVIALALQESINLIERYVADYRIDCNFKRVPGYLYAEKSEQLADLQEEYQASARAGLHVNRTFNVPLPFEVEEGIHISEQAIFNPLKYVQAMALRFVENGGKIYENSRVTEVSPQTKTGTVFIKTEDGAVNCQEAILATHTPIGFVPSLQTRLEPLRSYVIGIRADDRVEDALFWDMDAPYHYIRVMQDEIGPLVIIGGEDHKTGEREDTDSCFQNLERYARERFNVISVDYQWSAQLYDPADGLPYIGKSSGVYVATGYSGEGLTFGTLAAKVITDQILGLHNDCSEILTPGRIKPLASAGGFLSENLGTMTHFVKDRLKKPEVQDPLQVLPGEGAICEFEGQKVAVYHSPDGVFHTLSPVCTHMNCIVGWNQTEKSWDCPCHGGRFDETGKVLNGPPVTDLQPVNIPID